MKFDLSGVNFQRRFSPYSARRGCEHSLYMSLMPLKKKSNGCLPMRKFHENRNLTSPLWVCSVQPSWPGTMFSHNGQHNNNPNNLNLLEKNTKNKFPKRKFRAYR